MSSAASDAARVPLARVQALLGLSRTVIRRLVDAGYVKPVRGPGQRLGFSFEDLVLLRAADALLKAQVPPRRVLGALAELRRSLPADAPLTGVRLAAVGARVVVRERDGGAPRDAGSGQLLIDFDAIPALSAATTIAFTPASQHARARGATGAPAQERATHAGPDGQGPRSAGRAGVAGDDGSGKGAPGNTASDTAADAAGWFARGAEADDAGRAEVAEAAYLRALQRDPRHLDARLNLGALWSDSGRSARALALYRDGFALGLDAGLLHYNHAIALEDTGEARAALAAYARALERDPSIADAHFNAGRLLETLGDARGALRHFSAYRRAQRAG